ncbi:hypothetical protein [Streptomyces malaysiensis]|uniref:Uncharacterized protein n=1 Tax=Streptomyces malaysiensis subsp. samsunensis TaxID=459658 RepID=A0A9X2S0V2_STRMQ|nr:hypothetical protein [Streptomyces samsunensis]MCQ8835830.1 hypothetical protein [Streptomyces samsunensis]
MGEDACDEDRTVKNNGLYAAIAPQGVALMDTRRGRGTCTCRMHQSDQEKS